MRIALIGDFDTYITRGLKRPRELLPYHLEPGLNLLRGFHEIGGAEIHVVIVTSDVPKTVVEEGPFGVVHRLPCPRFSGSASFFLWRRHMILAELKKIHPDIVHGQGTEREYAFAAVTSPYPSVITFHGIMHRVHGVVPPPLLSLSHVPRWIEKIVTRKATDVICLSRSVESFLKEKQSPARCHLIPNAVGPCFFEAHSKREPRAGFSLLFVGTIYPLKGLLPFVEVLPIVQRNIGKMLRLRVIGPFGRGPQAKAYVKLVQTRAKELGVTGSVEWMGVQTAEEVAATLGVSDVLVLPSFEENLPMCIAEAMAAGVPVVASRVGGIPDLVEHNETGLLVRPGESGELAEALCTLLTNPELAKRLAAAAQSKALSNYAPSKVAAKTLAVYESILQRRG